MKKTINVLAILLMSVCFIVSLVRMENNLIIGIAGLVLAVLLFFVLVKNRKFLRNREADRKKKIITLAIIEMVFVAAQVLLVKEFTLMIVLYIAFNLVSSCLMFLLLTRKLDYIQGVIALVFIVLNTPLMFIGKFNAFYMFGLVVYCFSMMTILIEYPFDKRSVFKYILIGLFTGVLLNTTYAILAPTILFVLSLIDKVGKKKSLLIFLIIGLTSIGTFFAYQAFNNAFDITRYLMIENTNLFHVNSIINTIAGIVICFEVVSIFIYALVELIYDEDNMKKIDIEIYPLVIAGALLLSGIIEKQSAVYLSIIIPCVATVLVSYGLKLRDIPIIPHIKKYIKPLRVKKVSCVIPNYNYAHYIENRIDSVVNQTYPLYELIVLDDKSSDNSVEVIEKKLEKIKKEHPQLKVKFIPNKENSGSVFKQWERAFKEFTGDYLWIAEADDLCDKHFLNVVMKGFRNKKVVLSYAESKMMDENNQITEEDMRRVIDLEKTCRYDHDYVNDGKAELEAILCTNNSIPNASGVVFRRNENIDYQKYLKEAQEDFRLAGDWYFYVKVLLHGKVAYSSDSLNYHRYHTNSVTNTTKDLIRLKEVIKVQNAVNEDIKLSEDAIERSKNYVKELQYWWHITDEDLQKEEIK